MCEMLSRGVLDASFAASSSQITEKQAILLRPFLSGSSQKSSLEFVRQKPAIMQHKASQSLQVTKAAATTPSFMRWWDKGSAPNMKDIHSIQELTDAVSAAGNKLVVIEFYASYCNSCRALYPKLCKIAAEHEDVVFLKINFEENTSLCKALKVSVLPLFQFYRGGHGRLTSFSCSLSNIKRLKDALAKHNTERCSIGPPLAIGDLFSNTEPVRSSIQPVSSKSNVPDNQRRELSLSQQQ